MTGLPVHATALRTTPAGVEVDGYLPAGELSAALTRAVFEPLDLEPVEAARPLVALPAPLPPVEVSFTMTRLNLDAVALAFGVPRVTLDGPALAAELAEQPLDRWADDGGAAA